jgi:hypothetical protein
MSAARSRRGPFLLWFTCGFEHIDHAIKDDDMAMGISAGTGQYMALCGATVNAASMVCPPGRRCSSCEAAVLLIERESAMRDIESSAQPSGRGRHRVSSTRSLAGAGHWLFGWLKLGRRAHIAR